MKTTLFLLTLLSGLYLTPLSAQFSIGLKSGLTRAWEDYGDTDLPDDAVIHVNGYHISGLAYYHFNNRWQLGIEPGFVQRGAACVPGFGIFDRDTRLLLNYVELPLKIAYAQPLIKDRVALSGRFGFGTALITTAYQEVIDLSGNTPPERTRLPADGSAVRQWDHGLHGGLGLGYNLGRNQLFLSGDYYYGLRDVDPSFASQNRNLNFALGYLIRL